MKRKKIAFVAIFATFMVAVTGLTAADYVPGELIVKLEHGAMSMPGINEVSISQVTINNQPLAGTLQTLGAQSIEKVFKSEAAQAGLTYNDERDVYLLRFNPDLDMRAVANQLEQLPGIIYADPNGLLVFNSVNPPIDYDFDSPGYGQWGLENPTYGWDINALEAWSIESGDPNIRLAIMDQGLEPAHIYNSNGEFHNRVVAYYPDEYTVTEVTKRGNPITLGGNPVYHGTMMAGVAAGATNDHVYGPWDGISDRHGIAGVAGGGYNGETGVSLIASYVVSEADLANAIHISVFHNGADVINLSGGGTERTEALDDAIEDAFADDVTLFFATGNYGGSPERIDSVGYPADLAKYDICCAVGAIEEMGDRVNWSRYGPELSFVTPGTSIITTSIEDEGSNPNTDASYYEICSGTSPATAFASGVGALLYSEAYERGISLLDVDCKRIMELSAKFNYYDYVPDTQTSIGAWNEEIGYGCVDAGAALRLLDDDHNLVHATINDPAISTVSTINIAVFFDAPPLEGWPTGRYCAQVFKASGGVSVSPLLMFSGAWGRLYDGAPGYELDLTGNDAMLSVSREPHTEYNCAVFNTYIYKLSGYDNNNDGDFSDPMEMWGFSVWAPRDTSAVQIAYTYITTLRDHTSSDITEELKVLEPELEVLAGNLGGPIMVRYQLPLAVDTRIAVYDVTGREVTTLVSGEQPAGEHQITWEAVDNTGRQVSKGVYFIRMQAGDFQANEKVTLIR